MKRFWFVGIFALIAILSLAVAGVAFAQDGTPTTPTTPYGPGAWSGHGGMHSRQGAWGGRGGMMGGRGFMYNGVDEYGPMHDYMITAFADALGLTPEEIEARHDAGETMWDIALSQGVAEEDFGSFMLDARTAALEAAVADGVMTQEQADWMLSRMNTRLQSGYGPGSGGCMGGGAFGGRWTQSSDL